MEKNCACSLNSIAGVRQRVKIRYEREVYYIMVSENVLQSTQKQKQNKTKKMYPPPIHMFANHRNKTILSTLHTQPFSNSLSLAPISISDYIHTFISYI